jgi:hypothetical protein
MDSQRRCGTGGGEGGVRWGMVGLGRWEGGLTESESWYPHAPYPTEKNVLYTRATSEIKYQRSGEVPKRMDGMAYGTAIRRSPRVDLGLSAGEDGQCGSRDDICTGVEAR